MDDWYPAAVGAGADTAAPEPPVRYILTCVARTGSTMLTTCLQQHPDVVAHGEVFGPRGPLAFYGVHYAQRPPLEDALVELRDRDPVRFLYDFVFRAGHRRAVGCKLKYEELALPAYDVVATALRADTDVKVIHLVRDNLLERYLSQHIAVEVTNVFNVQTEAPPEKVVVRLDAERCEEDFARTARRQEWTRRTFQGHETLELTYEELVADTEAVQNHVADFLGVERRPVAARTRRLRRDPLDEVIENFDELARHFEGTEYERFFERVGSP